MCKYPSIKSCDEVEWKLMKEAGSVLMMIKKYNRIWHLFQISVIGYIIYVYLLSLRPSLTCIFHKTSICSAYIRLIFEVYRCKLLSANKNFKRRQFFLELQFPLFYRVSLHSLLLCRLLFLVYLKCNQVHSTKTKV